MDLMEYRRRIIASSPHLSHAEGAVASFPDGTDLPLKSLIVDIDPVQSGTGDPSPSNIRPISGWDAVGVHDTGVNIWDEEWRSGYYRATDGAFIALAGLVASKNPIAVLPSTSYYIKAPTMMELFAYDKGGNFISRLSANAQNTAFVTPAGAYYLNFNTYAVGAVTEYNNDISINYPSTDHSYHPYTGTSITVQLGRTVYGGTLNVLTGELVIDRAMVDLGTLTWNYAQNSAFNLRSTTDIGALPPANTSIVPNAVSSVYPVLSFFGVSDADKSMTIVFATGTQAGKVWVQDTSYSNAATFKTAVTGQMLVYELATPQTYTLDPQTVRSLVGQNNIFADTGNVALDYWAHP